MRDKQRLFKGLRGMIWPLENFQTYDISSEIVLSCISSVRTFRSNQNMWNQNIIQMKGQEKIKQAWLRGDKESLLSSLNLRVSG